MLELISVIFKVNKQSHLYSYIPGMLEFGGKKLNTIYNSTPPMKYLRYKSNKICIGSVYGKQQNADERNQRISK